MAMELLQLVESPQFPLPRQTGAVTGELVQ